MTKLRVSFTYSGWLDIDCSKIEWEDILFPCSEVQKRALDELSNIKPEELIFDGFDFTSTDWVDASE